MNRIQELFSKNREKLIVYLTAGYPDLNSTKDLVLSAIDSGADMIELGIPFSDPQADGPVIQYSNEKAIQNGINLGIIFNQLEDIRQETSKPIALMGYYNQILKWGLKAFISDCKSLSIDGITIPDLPLCEADEFCKLSKSMDISPILLVAPNTPDENIVKISKKAADLIYAVSIIGITGNDLSSRTELKRYLSRIRKYSSVPFMVGFGIKSYNDVKWFNKYSDGAVVGTAIIKKIKNDYDYIKSTKSFVKKLKGNHD